ncbi:MAG: hypothetical protein NTY22_04635, partial [Proteobacteria bacterium]|nr:hypothetical protein [Pseudomonadota bacterium]
MDRSVLSALIGLVGVIIGAVIASCVTYIMEKYRENRDNKKIEISNLISIITEINIAIKEYELISSSGTYTIGGQHRMAVQSLFDRSCIDIVTLIELYISDSDIQGEVKTKIDAANKELNILQLTEAKQTLFGYIR